MPFRKHRKSDEKNWHDWNHQAHLWKWAEEKIGALTEESGAALHSIGSRLHLRSEEARFVEVEVVICANSIFTLAGDFARPQYLKIFMEWPFYAYRPAVSLDGKIVEFVAHGPGDEMIARGMYLDAGWQGDVGWWALLAQRIYDVGAEQALAEVRIDRAAHIAAEPPCPFSEKRRKQMVGSAGPIS